MNVIVNTTVLSNFASVDALKLLRSLWSRVYLSDQVLAEVQAGFDQGYSFYTDLEKSVFPFEDSGWLWLTALSDTAEFRLFGELRTSLHDGEASSIAIAKHRQWTFLSDDKAARQTCRSLSVPVTGTIGVLLALVKHHHIGLADANLLLSRMKATGYYSPVDSLSQLLD